MFASIMSSCMLLQADVSAVQLVMNIPFTALYFASYETAKRGIMKHANSEESLLIQGVAGELLRSSMMAVTWSYNCISYQSNSGASQNDAGQPCKAVCAADAAAGA